MKKLWLVIFTSQEDWDSPTVVTVRAENSNEAYAKAIAHLEYDDDEVQEKVADEDSGFDYCVIEADEIIE